MMLSLTISEKISRMRGDLRMGVPVIIRDGDAHVLICSVETLSSARLRGLRELGAGVELVLTNHRAASLKITAYDGGIARISVPSDVTRQWIQSLADPTDDLDYPMRGPFQMLRSGNAHLHEAGVQLCKQAYLLPSVLAVPLTGPIDGLHLAEISELRAALTESSPLELVSSAPCPLEVSKNAQVHVFRPHDGGEEHYAIEIGDPRRDAPVLSRLHSACFTGDLIGSLKCDCGHQLHAAMHAIGHEGAGVLLYMNQEGRGIGLANKMRAYKLQAQGFDTVEANHRLGFEDDERDFRLGAEILRNLGFKATRLMTNNPAKVDRMNAMGVEVVERVPLAVGENPLNAKYLAVKASKSGHLL
jgi:GTP cyclohydrolase II